MPKSTTPDPYAERKRLTFAEAEGAVPLPTQLKPKEMTRHLRAGLWAMLYGAFLANSVDGYLASWDDLMRRKWVVRDGRPIDEYSDAAQEHVEDMKQVVLHGTYVEVFDLLQWLIRQPEAASDDLANSIQTVLKHERAAYRVVDGTTIVPISSEAEAQTISRAFADLAGKEFQGAKSHLRNAAEALTAGKAEDGAREAIQAVESVARALTGKKSFSDAMKEFEKQWPIHGALKAGFLSLYGYTSDEQGIRHPLIDVGHAAVDEADGLFMLGSCAAFVSYLIGKARRTTK